MRRELEMPTEPAGGSLDGQQGARVEIVAGSTVAVPVRAGVTDAPVQEVELRIVRSCDPGRSPASLPTVPSPCVAPRFSGRRDRPETPAADAGSGIVGVEEPADARLTATDADDDQSVERQRRTGDRV